MAKRSNVAKKVSNETSGETEEVSQVTTVPQEVQVPEGFDDLSADLTGFYKGEGEIFVKPLGYTMSDPKQRTITKPSILVHAELLRPAMLIDTEGEPAEIQAGERIGIWYKPGMRAITNCFGSPTFISPNGERDVGQIQPMKLFKVARKKGCAAAPIPCLGDYRKETRHVPLPWEPPGKVQASGTRGSTQALPDDDDDVPF